MMTLGMSLKVCYLRSFPHSAFKVLVSHCGVTRMLQRVISFKALV